MKSIWESGVEMPSFAPLDKDVSVDTLIIGGGIAGILCAYYLQSEGIDCAVAEATQICSKTTKNTTAKVTSQHGLIYEKLVRKYGRNYARLYYEANEEAKGEYIRLAREFDCDLEFVDSYIYSKDSEAEIEREVEALRSMKIPAKQLKGEIGLPFAVRSAVKFENQAQINPLKLLSHIAREIKIYENTPITHMVGNTACTEKHKIKANRVIVATHFPFINKHGFYFLKMYQERSYVIAVKGAQKVDGMYLDAKKGGLSFRNYGEYLLIGGGSHRTGKGSCAFDMLEDFAKKHYPDAEVKYKFATQDCITLDGVSYIGRYSKNSRNLYVATGFNKWGMSSSMVSAKLLSDMLTGRKNRFERIFSPSRDMIHGQLFVNTFEALGGWLSFGKKRCPHLGCGLTWNEKEHSWDCSCHGSRFDADGKLLDNPANTDMQ